MEQSERIMIPHNFQYGLLEPTAIGSLEKVYTTFVQSLEQISSTSTQCCDIAIFNNPNRSPVWSTISLSVVSR